LKCRRRKPLQQWSHISIIWMLCLHTFHNIGWYPFDKKKIDVVNTKLNLHYSRWLLSCGFYVINSCLKNTWDTLISMMMWKIFHKHFVGTHIWKVTCSYLIFCFSSLMSQSKKNSVFCSIYSLSMYFLSNLPTFQMYIFSLFSLVVLVTATYLIWVGS
jgi:hypothetical protein